MDGTFSSFAFTSTDYDAVRGVYVMNPEEIISTEKKFTEFLTRSILNDYLEIKDDFNKASELSAYWLRYAPRQRGRDASNEATPWGEVGEKVLDAHLYRIVQKSFNNARFIGLPYGHDVRFVLDDLFVHIDIKSTGPNDSPNDIVASLNQISGDGMRLDNNEVVNSSVTAPGPRRDILFQPELPPFYIIDNKPRLTLTFYIKCAYDVVSITKQPLAYLELVCVPNGLIMFDTLNLKNHQGVFAAGKDTTTFQNDKRVRIKLNPLSEVAQWRCTKITDTLFGVEIHHR